MTSVVATGLEILSSKTKNNYVLIIYIRAIIFFSKNFQTYNFHHHDGFLMNITNWKNLLKWYINMLKIAQIKSLNFMNSKKWLRTYISLLWADIVPCNDSVTVIKLVGVICKRLSIIRGPVQ